MDKFTELIAYVKNQDMVKRYKELEVTIHQDKQLLEKYEALKDLQKQLVNRKVKKQPLKEIEQAYNDMYDQLLAHPLMGEYLDLVEMVNYDLQMIQDIITAEINMDLS